jgi:hypothetical protein
MAKLLSEMRQYRMQINAAITVFKKRPLDKIQRTMEKCKLSGIVQEVIIDEDEVADREFAVEFKGNKVRENIVDKALEDLTKAIKQDMFQKGLIE